MAVQKLYAGIQLREIRTNARLTQKIFADRLNISHSYLNQMENNHRPISTAVILLLAKEFAFDVTKFSVGEPERIVNDMNEILTDPIFDQFSPQLADLQLMASNTPTLARAFIALHQAYRTSQEQLTSLTDILGHREGIISASPWEEVRDFFHYCDNYIDAIDQAAEHFSVQTFKNHDMHTETITQALTQRHDVRVEFKETPKLRHYDPSEKLLTLSTLSPPSSQNFHLMHQFAIFEQDALLEATLDLAAFKSHEARATGKVGLANYFSGAALMPYRSFLEQAQKKRHDLERLSNYFHTSIEQTAQRLSTLQRPGHKGIPFFFVRVDQAGTITKRHSASKFQFARFGGACPLWNVHRAFETPRQFLRQLAETPDGKRYFCLAKDVSKSGGGFKEPIKRYAIGLGCEIHHADKLIYADGLDFQNCQTFEPIGISCRVCERTDCHQRALPPMGKSISVNPNEHHILPYQID